MWSNIVTVGPLLAGISALIALALTLSKSAILRRREQTLRELKTSFTQGTRHYTAISQLHRATVAALVARQEHGAWRFIWPWLVWLVTAAVTGQTGFYLGRYVEDENPFNLHTFAYEVLGGDILTLPLVLGSAALLALVFRSYEHSLLERARTARAFYNTGKVRHTKPLLMLDGYMRERRRDRYGLGFLRDMVPGLSVIAVGLAAGTNLYIRFASDLGADSAPLVNLSFSTTLSAIVLSVATLFIVASVRDHRKGIEQLPRPVYRNRLVSRS